MDDTGNNYSRTEFQKRAAQWLLLEQHNVMVTFTFSGKDGVNYKLAEKTFGIFAHKLKCHLFGKKSKKRIPMCPIVEDFGSEMMWSTSPSRVRQGTHIHCLMRLPGNPMDYKEMIRKFWRASGKFCGDPIINCPNKDDWFIELSNERDRRELTHYALKKCQNSLDGVLIMFMPVRAAI